MTSKIDFGERRYDGELNGEEFSVYVDGTVACRRVPNNTRDQMRLMAADAFLSSGRMMHLSHQERNYWSNVRMYDAEHKSFQSPDIDKRGRAA